MEWNWKTGLSMFAAATCLVLACKNDDGDQPVTEAEAPEAAAKLYCDAWYDCTCDDLFDGFFTSEDMCRSDLEAGFQAYLDQGKDAGLTFNPDCFEALEQAFGAFGCSSTLEIFFFGEGAEALVEFQECKLYYGDLGDGDDCTPLLDEDGDAYGDDCVENLVCNEDGRCDARPSDLAQGEGQSCSPQANECEAGLVCVNKDGTGETCEALPSVGATCLGAANLCDPFAYCDLESKNCTPLPDAGQDCAPNPSVYFQRCSRYAVCNADEACEDAPGEGEDCTGICAEGLGCDEGTCVAVLPLSCEAVLGID